MQNGQRVFLLFQTALLATALAWLPACRSGAAAGISDSRPADRRTKWIKTELYFGLTKPDGQVAETEWREFVARQVTSRFPDGLTIIDACGQWTNREGKLLREKTKLIVIVHPDTPDADARIQAIRDSYRKAFRQESVLRVDSGANASF